MEIEEFKLAKAKEYRKMRESHGIIDPVYLDEIEDAYYKGIDFAIERFKEWLDELWDHHEIMRLSDNHGLSWDDLFDQFKQLLDNSCKESS